MSCRNHTIAKSVTAPSVRTPPLLTNKGNERGRAATCQLCDLPAHNRMFPLRSDRREDRKSGCTHSRHPLDPDSPAVHANRSLCKSDQCVSVRMCGVNVTCGHGDTTNEGLMCGGKLRVRQTESTVGPATTNMVRPNWWVGSGGRSFRPRV